MNYKKLIKNVVQAQHDNSRRAFALLAGLAAGAAIAVLFAKRSGRESRRLMKEKLSSSQQNHHQTLEDNLFDDLRETTRDHAEHLQGPQSKRKDPMEIKVPSAGTTAWKNANAD